MRVPEWLVVSEEVREALQQGRAVVALESTLIAHGLPWPLNLETAHAAEQAVRESGSVPATVAVLGGRATVGIDHTQIETLGRGHVLKASRRDLAVAISQGRDAATTVAATMFLSHAAGVSAFATGGIGGVHRDAERSFDISADLTELARTPVLVVCSGAKNILDLPRTLEAMETLGVPVAGFRTDEFPAFYVRSSGLPVQTRVDTAEQAARLFFTHRALGGGGMVLAQPVAEPIALSEREFSDAHASAEAEVAAKDIRGPAVTPFLLHRLAELTQGRSLHANRELIVANARLAGSVAVELARLGPSSPPKPPGDRG